MANVEKRGGGESSEDGGESGDGKVRRVHAISKDNDKEDDGHGNEEKRADAEPQKSVDLCSRVFVCCGEAVLRKHALTTDIVTVPLGCYARLSTGVKRPA